MKLGSILVHPTRLFVVTALFLAPASPPRPSPQIIHRKAKPFPTLPCHQQRVALPNPQRSSDFLGDNHSAQFINPAYDTCCPHRPCLLDGVLFPFLPPFVFAWVVWDLVSGLCKKRIGKNRLCAHSNPFFVLHSFALFRKASACRTPSRNAGRSNSNASSMLTQRCSNISSGWVSTSCSP